MYRNVRVIPKQLLEQLYVEKQWSVRDVADYFQCSVDTIMRRMKAYDIERRPLKKEINMVHVQALYETGKWSLHSLAKRYDVSITDDGKPYEGIWTGLPAIHEECIYRSSTYL